jgi:hypothetical protein
MSVQPAVSPPASGDDSQRLCTSGSRSSLRSRSEKEAYEATSYTKNYDYAAVVHDKATCAHPARKSLGSRRAPKVLDPSPKKSEEGEALEKVSDNTSRGTSRQEDRINHFNLKIRQIDASSLSDMSMTDDEANYDYAAVINDKTTGAHPARKPRGSRRTRVRKSLEPSTQNSEDGEALEKEPRGASRQEDRIEHFDLNIPQKDASSLSDMSANTDEDKDRVSVGSLDGKPSTRTKEARSSSNHRFYRENPSPTRRNLPKRRSLGRDNTKKSAQQRGAKSATPATTEEVHPGLLDLHDYHADDLLRDHEAAGVVTPDTPPMRTIKDPSSALPQRIVRRAQSENFWSAQLSNSDHGIAKAKQLKKPSPESVVAYLASPEWTDRQRIKEDWREFRKGQRESSQRTRTTTIPRPGLATHPSETILVASALESTMHLSARRSSTGMIPPSLPLAKAARSVELDVWEAEQRKTVLEQSLNK